MSEEKRPISPDAPGMAAFTLLQILIEYLAERGMLNHQDVQEIVRKSIDANLQLYQQDRGSINRQSAELLGLILRRVELGWPHHPVSE